MTTQNSTNRIKSLDGLRALAIIFVFLSHAVTQFKDMFIISNYNLLTPFLNGWIGVDLFFILSGFLITTTFIKHRKEKFHLKTYALKRILRIAPAYYATIVASTIIALIYRDMTINEISLSALYHVFFLQDYYFLPDPTKNINGSLWSLGVEEKFYVISVLFLPFTLFIYKKFNMKGLSLFFTLLILSGIIIKYITYVTSDVQGETEFFITIRAAFHCSLDSLLTGVFIAMIFNNKNNPLSIFAANNSRTIFLVSFYTLIPFMLSHRFFEKIELYDATLQPLIVAIIMGGLVLGAIFGGGFKWLENKILFHISILSYSRYLVHIPILNFCSEIAIFFIPWHNNALILIITFLIIFTICSTLCAMVLHYTIEKPFLKIKSRL